MSNTVLGLPEPLQFRGLIASDEELEGIVDQLTIKDPAIEHLIDGTVDLFWGKERGARGTEMIKQTNAIKILTMVDTLKNLPLKCLDCCTCVTK